MLIVYLIIIMSLYRGLYCLILSMLKTNNLVQCETMPTLRLEAMRYLLAKQQILHLNCFN